MIALLGNLSRDLRPGQAPQAGGGPTHGARALRAWACRHGLCALRGGGSRGALRAAGSRCAVRPRPGDRLLRVLLRRRPARDERRGRRRRLAAGRRSFATRRGGLGSRRAAPALRLPGRDAGRARGGTECAAGRTGPRPRGAARPARARCGLRSRRPAERRGAQARRGGGRGARRPRRAGGAGGARHARLARRDRLLRGARRARLGGRDRGRPDRHGDAFSIAYVAGGRRDSAGEAAQSAANLVSALLRER